jgi:hypothetical protein
MIWVVGCGWFITVLGGFGLWERYEATPGPAGPAPAVDQVGASCWHITVFAHPRCPCFKATLHELAELSRAVPEAHVRVVFVRPEGCPEGWERGEWWEAANEIPGVEVECDPTGAEAQRFGAVTSGQAVLMDPAGRVVFRGGLTPGRGRMGESAGRRAVLAWVRAGSGAATAPVYGCPLGVPPE